MLKLNELKPGVLVELADEGVTRRGTVVAISKDQGQALVNNGIQEFWFSPEDMSPILLDEKELFNLGFTKEEMDGGTKYKKDSFRLVTPKAGDFSHIDMWWREDRRHFSTPLHVHTLQNLYMDMTKVHLEQH